MPRLPLALLALVLAGCLPTCRRDTDRRLVPEDSLGRRVAEATPADSLDERWRRTAAEIPGLQHPRTVRWDSSGRLWVTDAAAARLLAFDADGRPLGAWTPGLDVPYLAGFRGDTVAVFSAGADRFDLVVGGRVARRVPVPNLGADRTLVRYGHVWGDGFAVKAGSDETPPFLLLLDAAGRLRSQLALPGPAWRHAGLLRARAAGGGAGADTLWSLCGYRPVADRFTRAGSAVRRAEVALVGFDSPKLAQSRQFLLGETTPPLLSSAAAPAANGDLFVLNLRTGWLLVDVFGPDGRLRRRLSSRRPAFDPDYFVEDLDVRRDSAGWLVATVQAMPAPRVTVYRWAE